LLISNYFNTIISRKLRGIVLLITTWFLEKGQQSVRGSCQFLPGCSSWSSLIFNTWIFKFRYSLIKHGKFKHGMYVRIYSVSTNSDTKYELEALQYLEDSRKDLRKKGFQERNVKKRKKFKKGRKKERKKEKKKDILKERNFKKERISRKDFNAQ